MKKNARMICITLIKRNQKNINAANTPDNLPEATHALSADEYLKETLDESIVDNDVE